MTQQIPLSADNEIGTEAACGVWDVLPGLAYQRLLLVNVGDVGRAGAAGWVLIDTGIPGMSGRIVEAAHPPDAQYLRAPISAADGSAYKLA